MGKVYLLLFILLNIYASSIHSNIKFLVHLFALFFGFLFADIVDRNIRLKKQGLKIPSFYDDFKKDFNTLTFAFKKTINALKISFIWISKIIFKGLKWLFKPAHIRLFFFLIKEGIFLFLALVFTVFVFVFMFTFSL